MLTDKQKEKFLSLRVEIIDLNILSCFYVRKINRLGYLFQHSTRHYMLEEFTALRYMENGLILHLTNLDDDSSSYSFRKVLKEVNSSIKDQKILREFKSKLDSYRQNVNGLKNKHRNLRIAHLNYLEDLNIDEFLNFDAYLKPLIKQANEIGDYIWGEKIRYLFKLGSLEGVLDFREIFEELKFDINAQREFV
jgi:hypothetical protein